MALPLPERIGPYQIASLLGQGGMGTVYRARDTKLNRDVAIKVLLAEVAGDAERLARFSREAQLLASLNHPNIAHLYGLEGGDGPGGNVPAHLVMELVEGPTLADRISQGPIPFDEALPIARQIADALETAHEQGIIHRDLKPANIKVRPDGTVKVLDFGLAKAVDATGTASGTGARDVTNSPTITSPAQMTRMGTILGTAAYMSPEQARGRGVDRRADIWAFGCVLYEMLTGRRAFEGDDVSITMASVLKDAVDWTALPADTPSAIRRLLRRCLEKDPRRRLSAIGDARIELDEAQTPPADAVASPLVARSQRPRAAWLAVGVVMALWIATLVPAWKYFRSEQPDAAQVRFTIPASDVSPQNYVVSWYPTISPDGQAIAYPGRIDTPPRSPEIPVADFDTGSDRIVWIRRLDTAQATPLAGTRGTRFQGAVPFWSADSHSLAFGSGTGLYRIDIDTGARQKICNVPGPVLSGTWGQDGTIVYADAAGGLYRVPATGGSPTEVVRPGGAVRAYRLPMFLPDSQHVIYQVTSVGVPPELHVRSLADGTSSVLAPSDSQTVYASGYLFFQRDGSLFAQLFDPDRRRLSGEARVVADGVYLSPNGRAAFDVSSTGTLVFRAGQAASLTSDLVWFNRKGETLGTIGDQLPYYQIRLSPDERRVAAIVVSATGNRMVMLDIPTRVTSRINEDTGVGGTNDPLWSPDGTTVAFESMRNKKHDFFERKLGTLSDTELYVSPDDPKWLDDWSHDGRFILFHASGGLFAFPLSGDRKPMSVIPPTSTTSLDSAHFSHDSKWFSFISKDASVWESWVASFPAADQRRQISSQGGGLPWWRADDKEIFYLSPDGKIMSVVVTKDPATGALDFKAPEMLFQSPLQAVLPTVDQYNVTGDGQRFLFIRPRMGEAQTPFNVIVNWTGSLRKPGPPSAQ